MRRGESRKSGNVPSVPDFAVKGFAVGTAVGTPAAHWVGSVISNGFWNSLDWLMSSAPPQQEKKPNGNTSRMTGCTDMQGNPCN